MIVTKEQRTPRSLAWASFILAIISIPIFFIVPLALLCFILSIIFGLTSIVMQLIDAKRHTTKSMAFSLIGVGVSAVFGSTLLYFSLVALAVLHG